MLLYCCEINKELTLDKEKELSEAFHNSFRGKDKDCFRFYNELRIGGYQCGYKGRKKTTS